MLNWFEKKRLKQHPYKSLSSGLKKFDKIFENL